ncbi:MAG: mannitol dehydrogenase family protein, partial [Bosea sp. (in: a-proteobacteria)]
AAEGEHLAVIGSVLEILVAPEDPERLIAAMADPRIRIVSLTVTEKGYCHDPATGTLNAAHPDIMNDVTAPDMPRSVPGYLVAALRRRFMLGQQPFTVLCCDNLPANGRTIKRVLVAFAALVDVALAAWVDREVACPSTMVDRIVPATSAEDRAGVQQIIGMADAWPVVTEPFTQWVIEDHFPAGRPRWELGGAEFVTDVAPFEIMKLRMLNGAHSALAYLGYLAGHETVAEASNDPLFIRYLDGLWAEIASTLPQGLDDKAYATRLLGRFQNRNIRHRLWQIAMDGSQKLPQRLLGTIRARLALGKPITHLAIGVAAWMRYVGGIDESGAPIDVRDPLAARLREICDAAGAEPARQVMALSAATEVFGEDLRGCQAFTDPVVAALIALSEHGVHSAISRDLRVA